MKTGFGRAAPLIALVLVLTVFVPVFAMDGADDSFAAEDGSSDYYYKQLDAKERVIYTKINDKAKSIDFSDPDPLKITFETTDFSDLTLPNYSEVEKAFYAHYYDHPEIFWITSGFTYPESPTISYIILNCTATTNANLNKQKSDLNAAVSKITIDGEFTYDKVKQIHDGIVENCSYDTDALGKEKPEAHSIYGIFVNGTAVCEGYAKAFMYMCQKYGVDVIVSIGEGVNSSGSESHMWNYVKMEDGAWYCMDVTWDDPLVNGSDSGKVYYTYYLVGADTEENGRKFTESHRDENKTEHGLNIPELNSTDYRLRPGSEDKVQLILCDKDSAGVLSDHYTLQVADIDCENGIREQMGSAGTAVIRTSAFQFMFTCAEMKKISDTLTAASITEVTFGGTVTKEDVKILAQYDFLKSVDFLYSKTKSMDVYRPSVSTGDVSSLGLTQMQIGISAEFTNVDLDMFLCAWDVTDPDSPQKIDAKSSEGYETFTVSSLGAYCAGNNPLIPGTDMPFLYMIGIVVLVFLLIIIVIKILLGHRKVSKAAKKMAKSKKNMQHYKQLYDDGELTRSQEKAYRKAVKIYQKNQDKLKE